jgi:hypothetical protein
MADVKISQLLLMDSPASLPITNAITDSDQLVVNDISSLITKRVAIEDILLLRNRNIDDTDDGSKVTGNLTVTGSFIDGLGNEVTDLSTLITQEYLESLIGVGTSLKCLRDSAPTRSGYGCGVAVDGELTVDSDLYVLGVINGDGSGLFNVPFAEKSDSADHARFAIISEFANQAENAVRADSAYHSIISDVAKKIQTIQVNTDAVYFPTFVSNSPGVDSVSTDANFTYNPNENLLTAGFFAGDGSLLTNITADATTATLVEATLGTQDQNYYVSFRPTATGADSTNTDGNFLFNPVTNVISGGANETDIYLFGGAEWSKKTTSKLATGTNYVMLKETTTGRDSVSASAGLSYDASTETFNATFFAGDGSSITNVDAVTATTATNVSVITVSDDATYYLHMGSAVSGGDGVNTVSSLRYNPANNKLVIASDTNTFSLGADEDLDIRHDGSNAYIDTKTGALNITNSVGPNTVVIIDNLPTVDPVNAGQLWNDNGTMKISSGV